MSTINDGDTAFPAGDMRGYEPSFGMTLRDYFAGQALSAMPIQTSVTDLIANYMARTAYTIADAMLAARSQNGGGNGN